MKRLQPYTFSTDSDLLLSTDDVMFILSGNSEVHSLQNAI